MIQMIRVGGVFTAECRGRDGRLKWHDYAKNMVVDDGLGVVLDRAFNLAAGAPWYVGLVAASPVPAAGDTMAVHAGWTEFVGYDEAARPLFVPVRAALVVANGAAMVSFTLSANATVGGALLTSSDVKGGVLGNLLCVAPFIAGDQVGEGGDIITVKYEFGAADDGV